MYKDLLDIRKDTRATLYGEDVLIHYGKEEKLLYMFSNMISFAGARSLDWEKYSSFWKFSYCVSPLATFYQDIVDNIEIGDNIIIGGL